MPAQLAEKLGLKRRKNISPHGIVPAFLFNFGQTQTTMGPVPTLLPDLRGELIRQSNAETLESGARFDRFSMKSCPSPTSC